jgi:hypothetical protein
VPTVLRTGPYRIYFVSHDMSEPPHVHVDRGGRSAKFWLDPVALARNLGYPAHEVRRLEQLMSLHRPRLLEAWNDFFRS